MMALKVLKLAVIFLFLAIGFPAFGLDYFADPPASKVLDTEAKLAQGFLAQAKRLFAAGVLVEADQWAVRGLQLDPAAADLLLLRSRIAQARHEALDHALDLARSAVKSNRWIEGRFLDAFLQMIDLLIQTHDYKTAREEFSTRFSERELLRDPRLPARLIHILFTLNEREKADALVASAMETWPDDAGIQAAALQWRSPNLEAHRWFDRFHGNSADYVRALFWYLSALPAGAERLKRCEEYLQLGGTDTMVMPWALESALTGAGSDRPLLESKWVDRFLAFGSARDLDAALILYGLLSVDAVKVRFWTALAGLSEVLIRDFDHDGNADEYIAFKSGNLQFWLIDANQDNRADLRLDWINGRLVSASQSSPLRTVRLSYDAYPEIDRVEVITAASQWTLSMPQGKVEFPVIEMPVEGLQHPLQSLQFLTVGKRNITMDPAVLRQSASEQTKFANGSAGAPLVREQIRLQGGIPVASWDDNDLDGRFDHLLWYEQGKPAMGFLDVENSGRFDAIEVYRNGQLSEIVHIDPVLNQSYRLDVINRRSEWDLDRNGQVDTKEIRSANEALIQWFSTRLDGRFDLRADDGQVIAVLLSGFQNP